jgi:hypothetical protein
MTDRPAPPAFRSAESPGLFDERSRPDFRDVFGRMLADASHVDVALTRLRLSALDLRAVELRHLRRLRLLLAEVNAVSLAGEAHAILADPERSGSLRFLAALVDRGVVRIRAAPLAGWSPDFTVFRGPSGPRAVLLGFHWLERPFPFRGPALASLHGPAGAALAGRRFDEAWSRAHDIRTAIHGILQRAGGHPRADHDRPSEPPRPQGIGAVGGPRSDLDTPAPTD